MGVESDGHQPHSAEYFGEARDHWWDPDFLAVVLHRWGLTGCQRVLDVGCGVGHWGRVLLPHLSPHATLVGIDREAEWVAQATARARATGIGHRVHYQLGDARQIPFPDTAFDLVTCQTVLIHVADVPAVIREMMRVLKPGGHLVVAEPNNIASSQAVGSTRFDEPVEQRIDMTRFQLICERGKEALGEGNNSVGDLIPGLLVEAGLQGVQVSQSSRPFPLLPPYATAAEQALRAQIIDWADRDFWIWSREDTRRYFLAGGGDIGEFELLWNLAIGLSRAEADALRGGRYHGAGGSICYLVSGTKPTTG